MDLEFFKNHIHGFAQSNVLNRDQLKRNFQLGLLGEVGEFLDLFKKHLYHGDELNLDKVKSEAGDILWYLFAVGDVYGLDIGMNSYSIISRIEGSSTEEKMFNILCGLERNVSNLCLYLRVDGVALKTAVASVIIYLATILGLVGITLEDCMVANIEKLRARHGGSTFDREAQRVNKAKEIDPDEGEIVMQYEIPEHVTNLIYGMYFDWDSCRLNMDLNHGVRISRLITETICEEAHGIFSSPGRCAFETHDGVCAIVDFSDLPLTENDFRENLVARVQRVGQAFLDLRDNPSC